MTSGESVLVIGGTGPTGPTVVNGLIERGLNPVVLHRGLHDCEMLPFDVEHIHADPHFADSLRDATRNRDFACAIAMYGRLRVIGNAFSGRVHRLITVGGGMYKPSSRPANEEAPRLQEGSLNRKIVEAEESLRQWHRQGAFSWTHLRYPSIYGPRQVLPREWSVIKRVQLGREALPLPDGGLTIYSRAFSKNAGRAVLAAYDSDERVDGEVFNVADRHAFSLADWAQTVAGCLGHRFSIISIPAHQATTISFWLSGRARREMTRLAGYPDTQHEVMDTTKAQKVLRLDNQTDFDDAVTESVEWLLNYPPEPGGSLEQNLGDTFDFDHENELIQANLGTALLESDVPQYYHPYDHPKPTEKV